METIDSQWAPQTHGQWCWWPRLCDGGTRLTPITENPLTFGVVELASFPTDGAEFLGEVRQVGCDEGWLGQAMHW